MTNEVIKEDLKKVQKLESFLEAEGVSFSVLHGGAISISIEDRKYAFILTNKREAETEFPSDKNTILVKVAPLKIEYEKGEEDGPELY